MMTPSATNCDDSNGFRESLGSCTWCHTFSIRTKRSRPLYKTKQCRTPPQFLIMMKKKFLEGVVVLWSETHEAEEWPTLSFSIQVERDWNDLFISCDWCRIPVCGCIRRWRVIRFSITRSKCECWTCVCGATEGAGASRPLSLSTEYKSWTYENNNQLLSLEKCEVQKHKETNKKNQSYGTHFQQCDKLVECDERAWLVLSAGSTLTVSVESSVLCKEQRPTLLWVDYSSST